VSREGEERDGREGSTLSQGHREGVGIVKSQEQFIASSYEGREGGRGIDMSREQEEKRAQGGGSLVVKGLAVEV
jgi:hypothetical protein